MRRFLKIIVITCIMIFAVTGVALAENIDISSGGTYNLSDYGDDSIITISTTDAVTLTQSNSTALSNFQIDCSVAGVNLTIEGINIDLSAMENSYAVLTFTGTGNNLTLAGDNTIISDEDHAGINVGADTELTISGTGTLDVTVTWYGAGIGGNRSEDSGTINITSGEITVLSESAGACIGGGLNGNNGIINITGGIVTANGNGSGAGLGGGEDGDGGEIYISGGTITAMGGSGAAGIGGGFKGNGGIVEITGGRVESWGGGYALGDPSIINGAGIGGGLNGAGGTIRISGGEVYAEAGYESSNDIGAGPNGEDGSIEFSGDAVVVLRHNNISPPPTKTIDDEYISSYGNSFDLSTLPFAYTVELATTQDFTITQTDGEALNYMEILSTVAGVNLTIDGINIDLSAMENAYAVLAFTGTGNNLTLAGDNTIISDEDHAGINVGADTELTISGTGTLDVTVTWYGAGIGGNRSEDSGTINITSGEITVLSESAGACIGGGKNGDNGIINITGGIVTANGNGSGAGLGGGEDGDGGEIYISGGTITAMGGSGAAGIGGGFRGNGGIVEITGGRVESCGGGYAMGDPSIINGAGIGGGLNGAGGTIRISGGEVYAEAGYESSNDIGAGPNGEDGSIEFSGDAVVVLRHNNISPPPTKTIDDEYISSYGNSFDLSTLPFAYTVELATTQDFTITQTDGEALNYMEILSTVAGVNLTIEGINIDLSAMENSYAVLTFTGTGNNLTLAGDNTIISDEDHAGINVGADTELTISGTGTLDVTVTWYGAGIGGNRSEDSGTINITSGEITVLSESAGACIGGGLNGNNGIINITGGIVTANGNGSGAGLGGGEDGDGGEIYISGGTITAMGGSGAAGIGGGFKGNGGIVEITGGRVESWGGGYALGDPSIINGAGIGGGLDRAGGTIRISGGEVYAEAGYESSNDIGAGPNGEDGSIEFSGDAVVFLRHNNISPSPTTSTHVVLSYEDLSGAESYGYTLPSTWSGSSDTAYAYLITQYNVIAVTGVSLDIASGTLILDDGDTSNDTVQLTATVEPSDAANPNINWSSSDETIATVDTTGLVTALRAGTATITVTTDDGGYTDTCEITVEQKVTGVSLDIRNATLGLGAKDTLQLIAMIEPSDADEQGMTWSSSDTAIATVNSTGLVTAVKIGTATITVTTDDGGYTDTCEITVAQGVTSVSLDIASGTLILDDGDTSNDTVQLTATVEPSDAANPNITWSSSDETIATVDTTGLVTALRAGTATITVITDDGGYIDTSEITVEQRVTGVSLDITNTALILGDGDTSNDTVQLTETVEPSDADNQGVIWTSSNEAVATVDSSGLVTGVSSGNAIITVTAEGGNTAQTIVTVTRKSYTPYTPSTNAYLRSLRLEGINLSPTFSLSTYNYEANVTSEIDTIKLSAVVYDYRSKMEINGEMVSDSSSKTITLNPGKNILKVKVTAENSYYKKTYIITVNRELSEVEQDIEEAEDIEALKGIYEDISDLDEEEKESLLKQITEKAFEMMEDSSEVDFIQSVIDDREDEYAREEYQTRLDGKEMIYSEEYSDWDEHKDTEQPKDKIWDVKFNFSLDEETVVVGDDYVTVVDEDGYRIEIELEYEQESKSLKMKPIADYEPGKKYYLIMGRELKNEKGVSLKDPIRLEFTIED